MDTQKTGAFIARLRKDKGLTQSALAEKLGLSNKAVSKWENGDSMPDIATLPELAKCLGVTVDELLNGEKSEQAKIKVEEVANEKNLINIFNICFAVSAFCCSFGALLGGFTEIYSTLNFRILFYNHWEIIFAAVSFFAIVIGNLIFCIAAIRLNVIYDKINILRLSYKKGIILAFLSYVFVALFLVRIINRYLWLPISEFIGFFILTAIAVAISVIAVKKIDKRLDNYDKKQ